jgi:transglutaminase-like putative cysteine protease
MKPDDHTYLPAVLGALFIAIAPHLVRIPFWIVIWCLAMWSYAYAAAKNNWWQPGRKILLLLTFGGSLGGLSTFGYAFGLDAGVALLAILLGLKPFEMKTHRDRMVTLFLIYFLIITNLLYVNNLAMSLFMFTSVLMTTAVLIHINHPQGNHAAKLRLSGVIMVQALPIMIVMFFLFPRIQGSLFGISKPSIARTGFADSLSPGSISTLVRSSAIAFRVEFSQDVPRPDRLYWRGIVFQHFDGKTWHRGRTSPLQQNSVPRGETVEYTIILEPQGQKWLFALDMPVMSPPVARMQDDFTLLARQKLEERIRYTVTSQPAYNTEDFKAWQRKSELLAGGNNTKSAALVRTWTKTDDSPEMIVAKALAFFRENDFVYTLNPPLLNRNPIDNFLFDTRKGYCEHYASAFAFLMRQANIPARIVGGYLGGELNPYGNYLIVRQSDAHAWVEVWLPSKGWVRVDPTSAVAPERVAQGMEAALPPEELDDLLLLKNLGPLYSYWKNIVFSWDAVNNYWNQWVLGYSYWRQKALLSKIGINISSWKGPVKVIFLAMGLIGLFVILAIFRLFKTPAANKDDVLQSYLIFCAKLAKVGLARKPGQGPVDFARKAGTLRRDLKGKIQEITDLYVLLRYGSGGDEHARKNLKGLVKKFNPKYVAAT